MGKKKRRQQEDLWVATSELPRTAGHPFYERLNGLFNEHGFDDFVEGLCAKFYADKMGRPSLAPGVYFRLLLVGYFEGIGSERGIAWRAADSLALREFLGLKLSESPSDHSTISRTRRLIDVATHEAVFDWVLKRIGASGLLRGKTIGIDATTLEANAALRSIVRRDSEQGYEEFLMELAKASGIETPRREDLAKLDRKRTGKGSNRVWKHPHDADARITRMKDGRTHLAHKAEHAVDLETGAIVSVTVQGADQGDTQTMVKTLGTSAAGGTRHRRGGGRQGVSQHAADGGPGCGGTAQLCERTEAREATLARRPAGAGSGVCESAAHPGRARAAAAAATRRAAGATLCASVRERRDETAACTGT